MTILFVILYFVVGLIVSLYLLATREGYAPDQQKTVDNAGCLFFICPEIGILVLAFWPVYVLIRICRLVFR